MNETESKLHKFWDDYADCVAAAGVAAKQVEWYVRWARDFAISLKGVPLRERTVEQATAYLAGLGQRRLQKWRIAQARVALEILYRDHLQMPMELPPLEDGGVAVETGAAQAAG